MVPVSDPRGAPESAASGAQPEFPAELTGTQVNPGWGHAWRSAPAPGLSSAASQDPAPPPPPSANGASADGASATSQRNFKSGKQPNRPLIRELPILVVVALIIAVVIKTFVVQAFVIPTGSMQDTLEINDKILVNKLVYHFRPIHAGDIVVFNGAGSWNAPTSSLPPPNVLARAYNDTLRKVFDSVGGLFGTPIGQTDYVKRVIGVPGDHVVCCNAQGLITVNGVPIHEQSYLYPGDQPGSHPYGIPGHFNVTVPAGYLWVLGDHRGISDDSRGHEMDPGNGMIPENKVIGRAFVIVWPPSQWRVLPIPATFDQPGITTASSSAAGVGRSAAVPASAPVRPQAPVLPLAAGFAGAVPLTWLRRRTLARRSKGRSGDGQSRAVWRRAGTLTARGRRGRR
jgi:signal peptidase I